MPRLLKTLGSKSLQQAGPGQQGTCGRDVPSRGEWVDFPGLLAKELIVLGEEVPRRTVWCSALSPQLPPLSLQ